MPQTIVILGAGFGGIRAAKLLGKAIRRHKLAGWRVTLVERNDYHTYAPLLYEVSAAPEEITGYFDLKSIVTFPLDTLLGDYDIDLLRDTVSGLDLENGGVSPGCSKGLSNWATCSPFFRPCGHCESGCAASGSSF